MTDRKIHLFTAPKHSGKTTKLMQWSAHQSDVFGILTPVIEGKRAFMDAHTRQPFRMEATANEVDILVAGKYRFSKNGFETAASILLTAANQTKGFIIVDEIGPLELRGLGFCEAVKTLLNNKTSTVEIVLVIREELVTDAIQYFQLNRFSLTTMAL